jgi:hypothetical protein
MSVSGGKPMNGIYFDFARCKCGHSTPIQPSTIAILDPDRKSLGMEIVAPFVACAKCKRVYRAENDKLESMPMLEGLEPYNPGAPMRLVSVSIECDWVDCSERITVIAVVNATATELEKEKATWIFAGVKCPKDHDYPWTLTFRG